MKKYYLVDNDDFQVYSCSNTKKEAIKDYKYWMNEENKKRWTTKYNYFSIYRIEYDPKRIEVDYWLDRCLYVLDKKEDELVYYENYKDFGIKDKILNYDFLFNKR